MKKIWIVMVIWAAVECLAFPEILFPDCIKVYQMNGQENSQNEKAENIETIETADYRFESFLLKYFKQIR